MLPTVSVAALQKVMELRADAKVSPQPAISRLSMSVEFGAQVPLLHVVTESMQCSMDEVSRTKSLPFNTSGKDGKGAKFCKVNWKAIVQYFGKTSESFELLPAKPHEQLTIAALVVGCTQQAVAVTRATMLRVVHEWVCASHRLHWLCPD
jgi:hypothetical protein